MAASSSVCAAAYQSFLRVGAPVSPFPHSSRCRLASGYLCTIPSRVPTPQCSQKGVSHPCPICIVWPGLRVVVSVSIHSLEQMFLNLILHHKCRHHQVPKYNYIIYCVCVRVSVNLVNKFLLTVLHLFFSSNLNWDTFWNVQMCPYRKFKC